MMAVMEVCQQGADTGAKRRARLHARWRRRAIAAATSSAAPAEQFHPRHDRPDRRQVDVVVAMAAMLGLTRNIDTTMAAGTGDHALGLVWRLGQRTRLAFARRTLASRRLVPLLGLPPTNAVL